MWNKIKSGLFRFMQGRYGVDPLNQFLLVTYLILFFLGLIASVPFLSILSLILSILLLFRMFSRNHYKRSAENRKFLALKQGFLGFFKRKRDQFRDRKTHIYRTCPSCKATLRLPKTKGEHTVKCPRCANRFDVHVK